MDSISSPSNMPNNTNMRVAKKRSPRSDEVLASSRSISDQKLPTRLPYSSWLELAPSQPSSTTNSSAKTYIEKWIADQREDKETKLASIDQQAKLLLGNSQEEGSCTESGSRRRTAGGGDQALSQFDLSQNKTTGKRRWTTGIIMEQPQFELRGLGAFATDETDRISTEKKAQPRPKPNAENAASS